VQEDFQQAQQAGVLHADAGGTHLAAQHRQGDAGEEGEVPMHIKVLRLHIGKTVEHAEKLGAGLTQILQPFAQAKITQVAGG
jgi:hypothetical protein